MESLQRGSVIEDRTDAGARLASRLAELAGEEPIVVGLTRGGVVVAAEIARRNGWPLEILVVRKVGHPTNPEYGLGAVAEGGMTYLDRPRVEEAGLRPGDLAPVIARERAEVERRSRTYRDGRPMRSVLGRTVVLVDDGVATGGTAEAAYRVLQRAGAHRVILAVTVAPSDTLERFRGEGIEVVTLLEPEGFSSVGEWYREFDPVDDREVRQVMASSAEASAVVSGQRAEARPGSPSGVAQPRSGPGSSPTSPWEAHPVSIASGDVRLTADLAVPPQARGIVVFAHGSGSGRSSPRNTMVARRLFGEGFGSLLVDLLTKEEAEDDERTGALRFDIDLLAHRLTAALEFVATSEGTREVPCGLYGASTGGAAALVAAAAEPHRAMALVLRGARTDLAGPSVRRVRAPTLMIVGSEDPLVLTINRETAHEFVAPHELLVVAGASHLFEERGALDRVAEATVRWFRDHLHSVAPHSPR